MNIKQVALNNLNSQEAVHSRSQLLLECDWKEQRVDQGQRERRGCLITPSHPCRTRNILLTPLHGSFSKTTPLRGFVLFSERQYRRVYSAPIYILYLNFLKNIQAQILEQMYRLILRKYMFCYNIKEKLYVYPNSHMVTSRQFDFKFNTRDIIYNNFEERKISYHYTLIDQYLHYIILLYFAKYQFSFMVYINRPTAPFYSEVNCNSSKL